MGERATLVALATTLARMASYEKGDKRVGRVYVDADIDRVIDWLHAKTGLSKTVLMSRILAEGVRDIAAQLAAEGVEL